MTPLKDLIPDLDKLLSGVKLNTSMMERDTTSGKILRITYNPIEELMKIAPGSSFRSSCGVVTHLGDGQFKVSIDSDIWFDLIYSMVDNVDLALSSSEWFKSKTEGLSLYKKYALLQAIQTNGSSADDSISPILEEFRAWLKEVKDGEEGSD